MRRATIVGFAFSLSPVIYAMGCAEQQEGTPPPNIDPTAGNTSNAGSGGAGGNTSAGKGGSTSPSAGSGGSTAAGTSGGPSGGAPDAAGAGGADVGAGGGPCEEHVECDDDNECTDDACNLGNCQHTNNTDDCEDDDDNCTDDVCAIGVCTHPPTDLCVCEVDDDCDDTEPCTDDTCEDDKTCTHTNNTDACDFDDNECTTDVCGGGECGATPLTGTACADDGTDCTDQICEAGVCEYTNNDSCECVEPSDCAALDPDPNNCSFDRCNAEGTCDFVDNDNCDVGVPFTINNFNSFTNWNANVTTPDSRALTHDFELDNLEGDSVLYIAIDTGDTGTLSMHVASMAGLGSIAVDIQSSQAGTAAYVDVGVFDGTDWTDLPFPGDINQGGYAVVNIPLLSFGVPLGMIEEVRFRFESPGSLRAWRINNIAAID